MACLARTRPTTYRFEARCLHPSVARIQAGPETRLGAPHRQSLNHHAARWPSSAERGRVQYFQAGSNQTLLAATVASAVASFGLAFLFSSRQPTSDVSDRSTLPLGAYAPPRYDTSAQNLRSAHAALVQLLGSENVDLDLDQRVARSATEWSPAPRGDRDRPSMIVFPRSTEDVSAICKICHDRRIPMMAFAGGTSLEATLAAQQEEVCLDFNKHMNKILAIRKPDMDVTLQPSVGYQDLNARLATQGLFFPPDPGPGAQIGGMIAQGCSGTNAYRYGTMKDWVLGLTVVLADGTIIQTRARPRKSASGYDLTRLFVGSEGTLGFVTEAHLRLANAPQNVKVAVAAFPSVRDAVRMAVSVIQSGHQLEAMELLDENSMFAVNNGGYCRSKWPERTTVFFKFAGTPSSVSETTSAARELAERSNCESFSLAETEADADEIWQARKTVLFSLLALKTSPTDGFQSSDACVPVSRIGDIIVETQKMIKEIGVLGQCLGHVGDGNFHAGIIHSEDKRKQATDLIHRIQKLAIEMGGTVSGEHGIGLHLRDQVVEELGNDSVDAMRRIKFALDPLCLLNPGKMIKTSA